MHVLRARVQPGLGQGAPRKFTLFDGIVSVAAMGLTLALALSHLTYLWANLRAIPQSGTSRVVRHLGIPADQDRRIRQHRDALLHLVGMCARVLDSGLLRRAAAAATPAPSSFGQATRHGGLRSVAPRYVARDLHLYVRGSPTPWLGRRCLDRLCDRRCLDHPATPRALGNGT